MSILDSFSLAGKRALVTGSARGLGAGIALALAEAGADVICHGSSRDAEGVVEKIHTLGRRSAFIAADLVDPSAPERLYRAAVDELGSIDILVNNAGMIKRAPAAEHPVEFWDQVIAVNLTAVFRLSQLAGTQMLTRGAGKIINIASLLSFQGGVNVPGYAAAKHGVAALTQSLANEWAARGVNVNAIAPGYMATDNTAPLRADEKRSAAILERIPAGRWGTPQDLAGAAVFLASPASDYMHGHILAVDGGWLAR